MSYALTLVVVWSLVALCVFLLASMAVMSWMDIASFRDVKALLTHIVDFKYRHQTAYEAQYALKADAEYNYKRGYDDAVNDANLDAMAEAYEAEQPEYSCSYHHVCSPDKMNCEQYVGPTEEELAEHYAELSANWNN